MSERFEFELYQDGMRVASCWGPSRESALNEVRRYASVYGQDGPVEIMERIGRKRVPVDLNFSRG